MKKILIVLVILSSMALSRFCFAGATFSESFKISVTIPAIIGLNVADPNISLSSSSGPLSLSDRVISNTKTQFTEIAMVRDNQKIILRTLVVL